MTKTIGIIGLRGFPANFPGSSGIDTYLENILLRLIKTSNYKINLYTRSWTKSKSIYQKIKIINIPCINNKLLDTSIYSILASLKAIIDNNILWFHAPSSCILLPLAKIVGKKIIFTYHGIDWQRKKWSKPIYRITLKFLELIAVKYSDKVTVVSEDLKEYIEKKYNKKCIITPPGFQTKKTIKIKNLHKFSLHSNSYILYLGRLVPEKRIDWLIKAYLRNKEIQKYRLIIAGFIENNQFCKSLARSVENNKNITFTNYVSGRIKDELISNCKLFVSPSELEGNSLSINEAVEFQRPCLLADIPVNQSLSKNTSLITLFKKNSLSDLGKNLTISLQRNKSKSNNYKIIPWTKISSIYKEIFQNL